MQRRKHGLSHVVDLDHNLLRHQYTLPLRSVLISTDGGVCECLYLHKTITNKPVAAL